MRKLKIYCMCLNDHHLENIKALGYIPVGLGKNYFRPDWIRDYKGNNISKKNPYYGEYTFYYWFWKNELNKFSNNEWVGFSGYRYHWSNQNQIKSDELNRIINEKNFSSHILKEPNLNWENHEVILGDPIFVNEKYKLSKIFKKGLKILSKNIYAFKKENRNIKLQFDVFHGEGLLEKAIDLLDENEKKDFLYYVNNSYSFNRENLFICRSKKLMDAYFTSVFSWLERCESIFGFNLEGYAKTRIYAFLAERYISYWFNKYSNPLEWPIFFFDTNKNKINLKNTN